MQIQREASASAQVNYGRKRLQSSGAGRRSHYQFKNFAYREGDDGFERYAEPVIPMRRCDPGLVNTCWYNPATRSRTLYTLALDLDFSRADKRWVVDDALSWPLMAKHLRSHHPALLAAVSYVVKSSSGRGLHVFFPISPLEIRESTESNQVLAHAVQRQLIQFFMHYGFGADPSARGLDRDFANFYNYTQVVHRNDSALHRAHDERERRSTLRELLDYLAALPFCGYISKKGSGHVLYPDSRAEAKFAGLYLQLRDAWLDARDGIVFPRVKDLVVQTSLSELLLRKIAHGDKVLPWLSVTRDEEGLRLSFNPCHSNELSGRAERLLKGERPAVSSKLDTSAALKRPEEIPDGERNRWITHASLLLKWGGVDEARALKLVLTFVKRIPGARGSRNCKQYRMIVRAIYRNLPHTFGRLSETSIPDWLLYPLRCKETPPSVTKAQKGSECAPLPDAKKKLPVPSPAGFQGLQENRECALSKLELSRLVCDTGNPLTREQRVYLLDEAFRLRDDQTGLSSLLVQARAWANNVISSIGDNIWTQEFAAALKALGPAVSAEERAAMFEHFERADGPTRKQHLHRIKALARMRTGHAPKLAPVEVPDGQKSGSALAVAAALLARTQRKPRIPNDR